MLLVFLLVATAHGIGLVDDPVLGAGSQSLDGLWDISIPTLPSPISGSIPGDLITDMERAGVYGDPLYNNNFDFYNAEGKIALPFWETGNVTYTRAFGVDPALSAAAELLLILDGVKMASGVWLNGHYLGTTANQFLRYTYPISALLLPPPALQTLSLDFPVATDPANAQARFMACSGGWDWAPYTGLTVGNGNEQSRVFSKGIWKSVSLVAVAPAALTALKVLTFYTGAYPTAPLTDATAAPFAVQATAYFWAPAAAAGTLSLSGAWGGANASARIALPAGASSFTLNLTAAAVALWWANGMGAQPLYAVTATFTPDAPAAPALTATRSVGFRTAYLVTSSDAVPAGPGAEGSGNLTMRFKLNGADVVALGGNMIPMEEMEGRRSAAALTQLVRSAAAAHFNVLRVWGGGIYQDDAFFDACDALGIMLYEDVMFGSDGRLPPVGNALELEELQYQVRRLASHPSIFQWSGCNECGGGGTYESFVAPTIAGEDPSRVIWPSCPSLGWATGVHTATGLPNGGPLKILTRASVAEARARAQAALRVPAPVPCDGGGGCTLVPDYDYDNGFVGKVVPAANASECCDACVAAGAAACYAASLWQGSCYLKPSPGKVYAPNDNGVVSVFPPGTTPPPPSPASCPDAESHGPYTHGYSASFPMVNGQNDQVNVNLPPATSAPNTANKGPNACGEFTSEFGASVFSSFESMAPTLPPANWALWGGQAPAVCTGSPWGRPCVGGNPMAQ